MKVRAVGLLAVLVLVGAGLSSCRTNVGTAAVVDGHRISENAVDDYADGAKALTDSSGNQIGPRVVALFYLVEQRVIARLVDAVPGKTPTSGAIDSAVRSVVAESGGRAKVISQLGLESFPAKLADLAIRDAVLRIDLDQQAGIQDSSATLAVLAKALKVAPASFHVQVNPRYGSWNATTLSVNVRGGQPPYLTLQSTGATSG